jgi:hypothetical protein
MKIINGLCFKAILFSFLIISSKAIGVGIGFSMMNKAEVQEQTQAQSEQINNEGNKLFDEYTAKDSTKKNPDLPDLPLYWQGWIKYLAYSDKDSQEAKAFWKNPEYENQSKRGVKPDPLAKDEVTYYYNIIRMVLLIFKTNSISIQSYTKKH